MVWWAAAAAGVQAASTIYDAYQGNKSQNQANKLNRESRERYQQMLDRYDQYYAPAEEYMAEQINQGPDLAGAAAQGRADFRDSYDGQRAGLEQRMQQYGINPGSSRYAAAMEDDAFNQAAGSASMANQARQNESDADWAKRVSWVQQGSNVQANALNGMSGQAAGLQQTADGYMSSAGAGLNSLGQMAGAYGASQANKPAGLSYTGQKMYDTGGGNKVAFNGSGR